MQCPILRTTTLGPCGYAVRAVDVLAYDDLLSGRRMEKARLVCTAGHSVWATLDRGPVTGVRPAEPVRRHGPGRPRAAIQCAQCQGRIARPGHLQRYCSDACRRAHDRARTVVRRVQERRARRMAAR